MKMSAPILKLSAPIYRLKRQARLLSRKMNTPLHKALDQIATEEGFRSWGQLAAHLSEQSPAKILVSELKPGDLVLLSARPGQGKTLLSLELAMEAIKAGRQSVFFSLEYNKADIEETIASLCDNPAIPGDQFDFDISDEICAAYIIRRLASVSQGAVIVIDYLQLLDQKRTNPDLLEQVASLKSFALERGITFVFISQIHRNFGVTDKAIPDLSDVRLPNPLDLTLFNKACFINDGLVHFAATG